MYILGPNHIMVSSGEILIGTHCTNVAIRHRLVNIKVLIL